RHLSQSERTTIETRLDPFCPPGLFSPSIQDGRSSMKHVLVTGGLGYLGSIVCEHLLDAGFQVTALDNLLYGSGQQGLHHLCANPTFDFLKGDVRDEATMRSALCGADVIVHLAAIVGAAACERDPLLATSVNLDAVRLLDRLRSPHQLVVYPNTNSGYGT